MPTDITNATMEAIFKALLLVINPVTNKIIAKRNVINIMLDIPKAATSYNLVYINNILSNLSRVIKAFKVIRPIHSSYASSKSSL